MIASIGFVFWGLFAFFGAIVLLYWLWMRRADHRDPGVAPRDVDGEDDST